jgi:cytochrome b561
MQLRNTEDRYGAVPQALHWVVVVLVLVAWTLGTFGDDLPRGAARDAGLFVHISAGLLIIALMIVRLAWRAADSPPPPEHSVFGVWGDRAARLVHYALYILLVAVPVVGIAVQFARGNALPILGWTDIASPWAADRAFARSVKEIHEVLANALLILAGPHAAAALVHHWILRDRTLLRMLPWGRRVSSV